MSQLFIRGPKLGCFDEFIRVALVGVIVSEVLKFNYNQIIPKQSTVKCLYSHTKTKLAMLNFFPHLSILWKWRPRDPCYTLVLRKFGSHAQKRKSFESKHKAFCCTYLSKANLCAEYEWDLFLTRKWPTLFGRLPLTEYLTFDYSQLIALSSCKLNYVYWDRIQVFFKTLTSLTSIQSKAAVNNTQKC